MRIWWWIRSGGSKSVGVRIKIYTCNEKISNNYVNIEYILIGNVFREIQYIDIDI